MKVILDLEKMQALADRMSRNAYKKAIRAGAKLIIQDVKANVVQRSGALKQSISSKVDSIRGSTVAYGIVGPRSKFVKAWKGKTVKPSRYASVVESGKHRRPFLLPAWEAKRDFYLDKVREVVKQQLQQEIHG